MLLVKYDLEKFNQKPKSKSYL